MNIQRPRRNRKSQFVRDMMSETQLSANDFIYPLFICEGRNINQPILALPGQFRHSIDQALVKIKEAKDCGIKGLALFPSIEDHLKDKKASESINPAGLFQRAIKEIKNTYPEIVLFTDVAMDPYSSDGHDGIVEDGEIKNDETLNILAQMALSQAQSGADFVAPSDMMDGRVGFIRQALDENGFHNVGIMSYSAKYASSFYGPFREALQSTPKFGDKKTYQMNPANRIEALRELQLDTQEGADILMVKPALSYLDIISDYKAHSELPIAAYNVSGEYAMVKAAAEKGWLNEATAALEILTSMKRAGADLIFTYHAIEAAQWLAEN